MEELSKNPGLVHIGEDILSLLDKKTALDCRLVNKSWHSILNRPKFWLMKLMREEKDCDNTIRSWEMLTQTGTYLWTKKINDDLEKEFILILMKMFKRGSKGLSASCCLVSS